MLHSRSKFLLFLCFRQKIKTNSAWNAPDHLFQASCCIWVQFWHRHVPWEPELIVLSLAPLLHQVHFLLHALSSCLFPPPPHPPRSPPPALEHRRCHLGHRKYDIWCSNDLQTVSGNVHHESWKCIFPFPLWRGLHAQRKIYSAVALSIACFPLPCLDSTLFAAPQDCHPWAGPAPLYLISNSRRFLYFMFAKKSPLKSCHVCTSERHGQLKRPGKAFTDAVLFSFFPNQSQQSCF